MALKRTAFPEAEELPSGTERYSQTMAFRNPNLVPTPIVNRNGVATTVHRKLNDSGQTAVFSKSGPPMPSAGQPSDEAMIDTIASTIRNLPSAPTHTHDPIINREQRENLRSSAHIDGHLQRVNELFASLLTDGRYGYNTAQYLLMNMSLGDANQVRLLNAYKDDYGDRYDDWREATKLGADLVANGITVLGKDDRIATLPAHIEACEAYEKAVMLYDLETWDGPDKDIINYADNAPYAAAVEKHAKDIDKIIEYRGDPEKKDSRGYRDAIKGAPFDVGAFEEYLSLGVLGDGAL